MMNQPLIGLACRRWHLPWLRTRPSRVQCLEITAEHFYDGDDDTLRDLSSNYPLYVHGLGLSLGTPGPLDESQLLSFTHVVQTANAAWISEHVAFTRSGAVDLGHLNPVPRTREMLDILTAHIQTLVTHCRKPVLMENITTSLDPGGEMDETDFLNRLCENSGCRLLLDVTNLFINARTHSFNPLTWLHKLNPDYIRQLHVVGCTNSQGHYYDSHTAPLDEELLELISHVLHYAPVPAVILERDDPGATPEQIDNELQKLHSLKSHASV